MNDRLADRRLSLEVTPAAADWLAIEGFDPAYGARPLRRVVQREIGDRLGARLADRRLRLEVTPAAREWLALEGFDPAYGARPLRRLVQREIGDRLARLLLAGEVRDGDTVRVTRAADDADGLVLSRA